MKYPSVPSGSFPLWRCLIAALTFTLILTNSVKAELICQKNAIKNGKVKTTVKTVATASCPKGYLLILDKASVTPTIAGVVAGGDLGGTYPNPVIGDGKVSTQHISNIPSMRIRGLASQSLAHSTWLRLVFDTVDYDPISMFSIPGNVVTIPLPGKYLVTVNAGFGLAGGSGNGSRILYLYKNSTKVIASQQISVSNVVETHLSLSTVENCSAGDTLFVRINQTSGVTLNTARPIFSINDDSDFSNMSVQWVGP